MNIRERAARNDPPEFPQRLAFHGFVGNDKVANERREQRSQQVGFLAFDPVAFADQRGRNFSRVMASRAQRTELPIAPEKAATLHHFVAAALESVRGDTERVGIDCALLCRMGWRGAGRERGEETEGQQTEVNGHDGGRVNA